MRLTLPSCLLLLVLPGWSFAQEIGEAAPRPEARPDAAEAVTSPAPQSVNEANSRAERKRPDSGDEPSTAPLLGDEASASAERSVDAPSRTSVEPEAVPLPEPRPETAEEQDSASTSAAPAPAASVAETVPAARAPADPSQTKLNSVTPAAAVRAAAALLASEACERRLSALGVTFETGESINTGSCGVLRPVSVSRLSTGIAIRTKTEMWCPVADALESWVTTSVVPAAKKHFPDREFTGISRISTYVCRNRGSGEKISEHARGAAIDIGAFVFEEGEVPVAEAEPSSPEGHFLSEIRAGACGPFATVLGPGTDADHARHFHFDLAARSNGPYCR